MKKRSGRILAAVIIALMFAIGAYLFWNHFSKPYEGEDTWVYIPRGSTSEAIADTLRSALGNDFGERVAQAWRGDPQKAEGAYLISKGDKPWRVARRLDKGLQTPVRFTFNNIRTVDELMERVCSRLDVSPEDFKKALEAEMFRQAALPPDYPAYFFPDTYQFYWNASAPKVVTTLTAEYKKFWNDDRRNKARALGLTPQQVATLASIVEEETAVKDERGKVARLYLNRLKRGMLLQADPTVKFAMGDFSLRRIRAEHLKKKSPYNTYLNPGLPPGAIRIPERATLDAVLNAPEHSYIYMCAKEDFSGRHNFATDYATHQENARRYRLALDRRGIK